MRWWQRREQRMSISMVTAADDAALQTERLHHMKIISIENAVWLNWWGFVSVGMVAALILLIIAVGYGYAPFKLILPAMIVVTMICGTGMFKLVRWVEMRATSRQMLEAIDSEILTRAYHRRQGLTDRLMATLPEAALGTR